ncbi:hypothetical protein [Kushneria marisflavi]|uniref:Uncharacterized protein n=1 Tax=Kushneria marisflavi TaxID=157779 RepID=A0A240ULW0_9GAMM|nr:hypothetical protein [Kushneria marisflavi]ART62105.1 hypothetical protein B9H00_02630 [Kushneria marisflavi]RKD87180.1 hypothetical protein C8D96_0638 [Kushneria marisflavi]
MTENGEVVTPPALVRLPTSLRLSSTLALVLLAGCQSTLGPMSWTSGYREVDVLGPARTVQRTMAIPNLCQAPSEASGEITLPPGCANDLNLSLMVANPRDLTRGQPMGEAMAAPVANAARERLNDRDRANERRTRLESEARSAGGLNATTDGL